MIYKAESKQYRCRSLCKRIVVCKISAKLWNWWKTAARRWFLSLWIKIFYKFALEQTRVPVQSQLLCISRLHLNVSSKINNDTLVAITLFSLFMQCQHRLTCTERWYLYAFNCLFAIATSVRLCTPSIPHPTKFTPLLFIYDAFLLVFFAFASLQYSLEYSICVCFFFEIFAVCWFILASYITVAPCSRFLCSTTNTNRMPWAV